MTPVFAVDHGSGKRLRRYLLQVFFSKSGMLLIFHKRVSILKQLVFRLIRVRIQLIIAKFSREFLPNTADTETRQQGRQKMKKR